jgi:ribosomal subunit interface protein
LDKVAAHFKGAVAAQVEAGRTTRHHRSGHVFRVEIMVHVKGGDLRAEATGKTVLEAMDKAQEEMRTELERLKEKDVDAVKTGGRAVKKMLKGE